MATVGLDKAELLGLDSDITSKLKSLQFESALSVEESNLTHLRKRSHAIIVSSCAEATYFTSVLGEAKQVKIQLKDNKSKKASRLLQELAPKDPLLVGIIGGGRLGVHLANCLLTFGEVSPSNLRISTRRPETLNELKAKGVLCLHDNKALATTAHLLFICVLPSQMPMVAQDIKGHITKKCLVYSFSSSVGLSRTKQLFDHKYIVKPEFQWREENKDRKWNFSQGIAQMFETRNLVELTCPLTFNPDHCVVQCNEKFGEALVYAFINFCTDLGLNKGETVDTVNAVLLGHNTNNPLEEVLVVTDITKQPLGEHDSFPKFDIISVTQRETPLTEKLMRNKKIRTAFVNNYCRVFERYMEWRNHAFNTTKK